MDEGLDVAAYRALCDALGAGWDVRLCAYDGPPRGFVARASGCGLHDETFEGQGPTIEDALLDLHARLQDYYDRDPDWQHEGPEPLALC